MFHYASGKDRRGIIATLLQKLAGITDPDILVEYQLSGLDTRPEKLQDVLQYVEQQAGINRYLEMWVFPINDQEVLAGKIRE